MPFKDVARLEWQEAVNLLQYLTDGCYALGSIDEASFFQEQEGLCLGSYKVPDHCIGVKPDKGRVSTAITDKLVLCFLRRRLLYHPNTELEQLLKLVCRVQATSLVLHLFIDADIQESECVQGLYLQTLESPARARPYW